MGVGCNLLLALILTQMKDESRIIRSEQKTAEWSNNVGVYQLEQLTDQQYRDTKYPR